MNKGLLLAFRLAVLAFVLCLSPVVANAQRISLKVENATLESVLDKVEQQSRYLFLNDQVDLSRRVTVDVSEQSLESALTEIFEGMNVAWNIQGTNVYISNKPAHSASQQTSSTVSGTVVDAYGQPVMGAAVLVKGTLTGTSTDLDGRFSFELPAGSENGVLEVSCLGYKTRELAIGSRREFNVVLEDDTILMEGTVVTALGIKRSEKALSYNVQKVDSDAILGNKDANFVNSLNGKVAGLVINASSSGVGGSSKVVMRGEKSISKSSNALYVIDGVPMFNVAKEAGTEFSSQGTTDPVADINPEDIESMTVLTGAAAAALYGSSAANGAIVITTKKGQQGKTSVTVSSNTDMYRPFVLPRFQNRYGTGDYSSSEGSIVRSWGNRLNETNYMGYDPARDYFQLGITGTESVSLSTGTEKNQTYLSAAAVNSRGNIPNNSYNRYNFTFRNTTSFLDDRMTLDVTASYIMQNDRNMTNQGVYNNPVVGAYLFPRGNDWEDIRMYERYDTARSIYTQYWPVGDAGMTMQNPYWINYRNLRVNKKDRYMLGAGLSYKILDWMTLSGRVRIDNSTNKYTEKFFATTNTQLTEQSNNGLYGLEISEDKQVYADALLDINKTWNDWSLHANVGASISDMRYDLTKNRGPIAADNLPNVFSLFTVDQGKLVKAQSGWREQTQSVYASAEIGFKGAYYLTLTGRNDWPSQLAGPQSGAKGFFYPSVGASAVLSQIIPNMPKQLEYLKIRASYASVGSPFERFIANPLHTWPEKGSSWNQQTSYPVKDLKPERTDSWEAGLSMRFLNWFNLEATYYHTDTRNQTIYPTISSGSGYSSIPIQSGSVLNQGLELALGFDKTWGIFNWQSNYTFSMNRNKIRSLTNCINPMTGEPIEIGTMTMGGLGNVKFLLKEGGSLGDIYSRSDLKRDSNNDIYVDEKGNIATQTIDNVDNYIKLEKRFPNRQLQPRIYAHGPSGRRCLLENPGPARLLRSFRGLGRSKGQRRSSRQWRRPHRCQQVVYSYRFRRHCASVLYIFCDQLQAPGGLHRLHLPAQDDEECMRAHPPACRTQSVDDLQQGSVRP